MEFNFKLTLEQTNIVLNALSKEPYNVVFTVIDNLRQQAAVQQQSNDLQKPVEVEKEAGK